MSSDDNNTATMVEYDALFYKRSTHSKVHKSKGVSKLDGILTIHLQQQTVSLRCCCEEEEADDDDDDDDDDDESNEDDDDKKMTWKERRKKTSQAGPRGVVYTGKLQGDLMVSDIKQDTTIILGTFDVEVGSRRRSQAASDPKGRSLAAKKTALVSVKPKTTTGLSSIKSRGGILPTKRKPIAQPTTTFKRPPPQLTSLKRPPPQPRKVTPHPESPTTTQTKFPTKVRGKQVLHRTTDNIVVAANKTTIQQPHAAVAKVHHQQSRWTQPSSAAAAAHTTVLPHIPLPVSLRQVLRPHQVEGVDFLWKAFMTNTTTDGSNNNHGGAILADEMGLGKTLMSIAVLAAWHRTEREHSHVVVCPSSLVRNWESEFDKWLGKASRPNRVVIRTGGEEGLQKIRAFASNQSQTRAHRVGQVLIVSYDLFRMHTQVVQQAVDGAIGLLLVDEGHRLKNTSGSQTMTALESLQARSRLLISASPVQNNLSEFYSLVEFVRPGLLGSLSSFRKEFERPIAAANRKNATPADRELADRQSRVLEALTRNTILRRLQSEVLANVLPPRTEILLFCKLSNDQQRFYQSLTTDRLKHLSGPGSFSDALETLTELRKLCTHPSLLKNTPPEQSIPGNISSSGKLAVLSLLLNEIQTSACDDKVVIVSNFTSALSLIEELILKPNNMSYLRLDGSVNAQNRQTLVDTFTRTSASVSFCFLLSAKAGGCGLNLVGANKLVMFDPDWNPATDLQAMGRIYRTGQTRPTTIYRLFSTGTLEEIIYQRQLQKGALASVTVDGLEDGKASFSPEELKECMTLKTNTESDTKDKMGKVWPDFASALQAKEEDIDKATKRACESDLLTFVHFVDEDTSQKRSSGTALSSLNDTVADGEYASDTSEEEFVETGHKKRRGFASKTTVLDDSPGSEDEEMEFS
eukprot:scaffold1690_cov182-Amphora_coffeaeformis.AAC.52